MKLTAEGDVHLSDEALSSLGTTSHFLSTLVFGAITQIYDPHARIQRRSHPTHLTRPPEPESTAPEETESTMYALEQSYAARNSDHHPITIKPTRPKIISTIIEPNIQATEALNSSSETWLTDFMPFLGYFAAGGLSGITSRTVTAPLDRLKVYLIAQTGDASEALAAAKRGAPLQATKAGMSSMWNACKAIWADGGIRSVFAGQCESSVNTIRS